MTEYQPADPAQTSLEDVEEALKDVIDPELGVNVVDLGLLYGLRTRRRRRPADRHDADHGGLPAHDVIEEQVEQALDGIVDDWRINWVWMPPWGPETDHRRRPRPDAGPRLQHLVPTAPPAPC